MDNIVLIVKKFVKYLYLMDEQNNFNIKISIFKIVMEKYQNECVKVEDWSGFGQDL